MSLVTRCPSRPHLGIGKGYLQCVQVRHALSELGRGHPMGEADESLARDIHIDQHAGDVHGIHRHRLWCHRDVDVVPSDEAVNHVKVTLKNTIERDHPTIRYTDAGLWIGQAGKCRKAIGGIFGCETVQPQGPVVPVGVALPAIGNRIHCELSMGPKTIGAEPTVNDLILHAARYSVPITLERERINHDTITT